MKKSIIQPITQFILIVIIVFTQLNVSAQDDQFRVISCTGNITHNFNDEVVRVLSGAKIKPEGKLILGDGSRVKLICKDRPYTIHEKGEYDLVKIYSGSANQSMSFTGKFWNFIMDGLRKSDSKSDLKAYRKKYSTVSGGIKGYSSKNGEIKITNPYSGKITHCSMQINWADSSSVKRNGEDYTISIINADDRYIVFKREVAGTGYLLKESECNMILGNNYYIRVEGASESFDEISLEYVQMDTAKVNRRLSSLLDFDKSSPIEKQWMRATVLEMEGYVIDADAIYKDLLSKNLNDGFVNKLYNLFLTRNNQIDKVNDF